MKIQWFTEQGASGRRVVIAYNPESGKYTGMPVGELDIWKFRALIKNMVRELEGVG